MHVEMIKTGIAFLMGVLVALTGCVGSRSNTLIEVGNKLVLPVLSDRWGRIYIEDSSGIDYTCTGCAAMEQIETPVFFLNIDRPTILFQYANNPSAEELKKAEETFRNPPWFKPTYAGNTSTEKSIYGKWELNKSITFSKDGKYIAEQLWFRKGLHNLGFVLLSSTSEYSVVKRDCDVLIDVVISKSRWQ